MLETSGLRQCQSFTTNPLVSALNRTPNSPFFHHHPSKSSPRCSHLHQGLGREIQGQELGIPDENIWEESIFRFLTALCGGPEASKPCPVQSLALSLSSPSSPGPLFPGPSDSASPPGASEPPSSPLPHVFVAHRTSALW